MNPTSPSAPLKTAGTVFAMLIMIGFASFPIMFYFDIFGVASNILNAGI